MSITIRTPAELADEYLANLKALRPEVNIDQEDSDWWIRSRVVGGVSSGVSSDISRVSNDCFPQSARREALEQHLITYFGSGFLPATNSVGTVEVAGASGTAVPAGTRFKHSSTSNEYVSTDDFVVESGGTVSISVESTVTGQDQNLLTGTELEVQSPPAGITATATVESPGLSDGRDEESDTQAAQRILQRIRNPVRGGTEADYITWARNADASVVQAKVLRHAYGLGSVLVLVSAGTSDIDAAIDGDDAIVITPTAELLETVRTYIDGYNPITDAVYTAAPNEIPIDVDVTVTFESGDETTIVASAGATQGELVEREVRRAIYKTPVGGRTIGANGYVLASDIEAYIDLNLAYGNVGVGLKYQIVTDRQVDDLSATGANRMILSNEVAVPGNITLTVI